MGFRTVVVKSRVKLDYSLNYLVCRGEKETKIHLSEISMLIIETTAVSLTACLLVELNKHKIKVLFCDEKHLPCLQMVSLFDNFHSTKQLLMQINWQEETKKLIWTNIIKNKIINQSKLLKKYNLPGFEILEEYSKNVEINDLTNREGHSAKVYFNILFANEGRRVPTFYNSALNYGYAILLSAFCREITSSGCITQLGVWHKNEYNEYNLACDFMETYRVIVDDLVLSLDKEDKNFKEKIARILECKVLINGKKVYLENAISIYTRSLIKALNKNDITIIKNYKDYELPIYENFSDV